MTRSFREGGCQRQDVRPASGTVTGAVWFAILFFRRHPTQHGKPPALPESEPPDGLALDDMNRRLLELEERLDATEHVLMREKVEQPRKRSQ